MTQTERIIRDFATQKATQLKAAKEAQDVADRETIAIADLPADLRRKIQRHAALLKEAKPLAEAIEAAGYTVPAQTCGKLPDTIEFAYQPREARRYARGRELSAAISEVERLRVAAVSELGFQRLGSVQPALLKFRKAVEAITL